jgi:DNA-binding transcriptional regulator YdaS (Cro superfamily)
MTMKTITALKAWMQAATVAEQDLLAEAVGTSRGMLHQYAGGHREVSAARAGEFEAASKAMARASKGRLPVLLRTDLTEACRQCSYAQRCLGPRAVASEFPIVSEAMLELETEGGSAD